MTQRYKDAAALMAAAQNGELTHEDYLRYERELHDQSLMSAIARARDGETDWDSLTRMMGRNERPDLLVYVWMRLPQGQLIKAVGDAWVMCEVPERRFPRKEWLPIFRAAGYHVEDVPATPPDSITLWRGGLRKTRMAWTAEWFQHRFDHIKPGKLWTITVGPDRLLAHYHEKHRHEDEYVIDPTGIRPMDVR